MDIGLNSKFTIPNSDQHSKDWRVAIANVVPGSEEIIDPGLINRHDLEKVTASSQR